MKKQNPILTLASVILVMFLFAPVLIRALNVSSEANFKKVSITSTTGTPSKLDGQLPFEEREKEEKATMHSLAALPLIAILAEPFLFQPTCSLKFQSHHLAMKCEQPPRYLIIRSLLI